MKYFFRLTTFIVFFAFTSSCEKETYTSTGKVSISISQGPREIGIFDTNVFLAPFDIHERNALFYFRDVDMIRTIEVELNPGTYICGSINSNTGSRKTKYFQIIKGETTLLRME
jgi:hypothetical protein